MPTSTSTMVKIVTQDLELWLRQSLQHSSLAPGSEVVSFICSFTPPQSLSMNYSVSFCPSHHDTDLQNKIPALLDLKFHGEVGNSTKSHIVFQFSRHLLLHESYVNNNVSFLVMLSALDKNAIIL